MILYWSLQFNSGLYIVLNLTSLITAFFFSQTKNSFLNNTTLYIHNTHKTRDKNTKVTTNNMLIENGFEISVLSLGYILIGCDQTTEFYS